MTSERRINSVFIIAEIAQAHDGSLGIAHSYIDALKKTGVNAIKFQTHIAEAESSEHEAFRVNFSYEDNSRFDYWKRMEFTFEQWQGLKRHCDDLELEFISSPFSLAAVDLLENLNVNKYKIGSGEISNLLMLQKIARTKKEIILSSGMSSIHELSETIKFLKPFGNQLSLLQCTTAYPTKPHEWGLGLIQELKSRFGLRTGFSDHSGDIYACLAAATLGAEILEFHAVFDQNMFGPDAQASITINRIAELVHGVRQIETALNHHLDKNDVDKFAENKILFGKSIAVNKTINKGETLTIHDLESKKPGNKGIAAKDFESVIGRKLKHDLAQWSFLTENDIEP